MTSMTRSRLNSSNSSSSSSSNSSNVPLPPPKPSHLSSAFTGTLNSEALRNYIQAQKTGDSNSSFNNQNNTLSSNNATKIILTKSTRAKALKDLYTEPNSNSNQNHGDESLNDKEANEFNSIVRDELVSIDGFGPKTTKSVVQGWLRSTGAGAPSHLMDGNANGNGNGGMTLTGNSKAKGKGKQQNATIESDIWAGAENESDSDDDDDDNQRGIRGSNHDRFVSTATSYGTAQDYPSPIKEGNSSSYLERDDAEEDEDEIGERSFHDRDESTATVRGPSQQQSSSTSTSNSHNQNQTLTKQIFKNSTSSSKVPFSPISLTSSNSTNRSGSGSGSPSISSPIEDSFQDDDDDENQQEDNDKTIFKRRPSSSLSNTTTERSRAPSLLSPSLRSSAFFKSNQDYVSKGFDLEKRTVESPSNSSSFSPTPSPEPETRQSSNPNSISNNDETETLDSNQRQEEEKITSTSRLNLNVAGPPPLRPQSVSLDLEKEIETLESAYKDQERGDESGITLQEVRESNVGSGESKVVQTLSNNDGSMKESIVGLQDSNPRDSIHEVALASINQEGLIPIPETSIPILNEPIQQKVDSSTSSTTQSNPEKIFSSSINNSNPMIAGKPARALYDFIGEPSFNELTLTAGQSFEILNEQLRGGWSLGLVREEVESEIEIKRGLVPQGWYCYIQDFTISPNIKAINESSTSNESFNVNVSNHHQEEIDSLTPLSSPPISISNGNAFSSLNLPLNASSSPRNVQSTASYRPTSSGQIGTADFSDPDPIAISLPNSNSSNQVASAIPARAVVGLDISGTPDRAMERMNQIDKDNELGIDRTQRAKLALSLMYDRDSEISNSTPKSSRFLGNKNFERERKISSTSITSKRGKELNERENNKIGDESSNSIGNSSTSTSSYHAGNQSMESQNPENNSSSTSSAASSGFISFPFSSRSVSTSTTTSTNSATTNINHSNQVKGNVGWKSTLFGGKSLNRFSNFVTSGVEDYIISNNFDSQQASSSLNSISISNSFNFSSLSSSKSSDSEVNSEGRSSTSSSKLEMDSNCHFVKSSSNGPSWKSKSPNFFIVVHDPQKRSKMNGMSEYTVFSVSSLFPIAEVEKESNTKTRRNSNQNDDNGIFEDENDDDDDDDQEEEEEDINSLPYDPTIPPNPPGPILTVFRRYSQFCWLFEILKKNYPALILPPLPSKQYSGRFASEFIETRRSDLELWLSRIIRHPLLRYSDVLLFFLSCQDDLEWKKSKNEFEKPLMVINRGNGNQMENQSNEIKKNSLLEGPSAFFANTFHPEFNIEIEEAEIEVKEMERFSRMNERAVNGGNQGAVALTGGVMGCLKSSREGDAVTSNKFRELSYSLLRLITGQGLSGEITPSSNTTHSSSNGNYSSSSTRSLPPNAENHFIHGPPMGKVGKKSENGATNEEGSWCWREGCKECNSLTKALQGTAECLQDVADAYDDHARSSMLRIHERLKAISRPHAQYEGLFETHRATVEKHKVATAAATAATSEPNSQDSEAAAEAAERMVSRCETVLNVTMAEMDRAHRERVEDWTAMGRNYLDTQIDFYEGILATLRHARLSYDAPEFNYLHHRGPVLPSIYDSELNSSGRTALLPLPMPSAPVLPPSATETVTRPISLAGEVISEHLFGSTPTNEIPSYNSNPLNSTSYHKNSRSINSSGKENSRSSYFSLWQ